MEILLKRVSSRKREEFRRIKSAIGKKRGGNITSLKFLDEHGEQQEAFGKEAIKEVIKDANQEKFHQCEATCSFLKEPLLSDFGRYGEGIATNQVYEGTYNIPAGVDDYTADFIKVCSNGITQPKPLPSFRSPSTFISSWNKMKETTNSNGDLHFGHFKAGMAHENISLVHYLMAEIPYRTGYSPKRWKSATDVMILKNRS